MLALLLLQAATPQTAVEAERAFARAAQEKGQWTAFRDYAAPDAVMFVPQPINAQAWLKDRKDPPKSVEWWPTESYVSCSGTVAVNTGGWIRPDGSVGYFSTVWSKQKDGSWTWLADHGAPLATPREKPSHPKTVRASCGGKPEIDMGGCLSDDDRTGCYAAEDQSLQAHWSRDGGTRVFHVTIWTGREWKRVLEDVVIEDAQ